MTVRKQTFMRQSNVQCGDKEARQVQRGSQVTLSGAGGRHAHELGLAKTRKRRASELGRQPGAFQNLGCMTKVVLQKAQWAGACLSGRALASQGQALDLISSTAKRNLHGEVLGFMLTR